jgi:hypothetical protein
MEVPMTALLRRLLSRPSVADVDYCEECGGVCDAGCRARAAADRVRELRVTAGLR